MLPLSTTGVSFVIATYNRRDAILHTLSRLHSCGLAPAQFEIFVIDNASVDGTGDAITAEFPQVRLIRSKSNRGSCAKNLALPDARGKYIVFLDDDSFPLPGSVPRMMRHFESDPTLGAAGFTVTLPDGSRECSAYPDVFIGCGVGFRRRALNDVGGLPEDFFMQAEEYDLSLRLIGAGWRIRTFDDLHVSHLKTATARRCSRVMRLDVRNNYRVATRYFPRLWRRTLRRDWMRRYRMIASEKRMSIAYWIGLIQGFARSLVDRRRTIDAHVFEQFSKFRQIDLRTRRARDQYGIRRAIFIDYGKNILPYWLAARACGIEIVAIADESLAGRRRKYRGIPIVNDSVARRLDYDAAIVSNLSPVHAHARATVWRRMLDCRLVIDLFDPSRELGEVEAADATSAGRAASQSRQTAARIA